MHKALILFPALALTTLACSGMPKMPEVPKVPDAPGLNAAALPAAPGLPGAPAAPGAAAAPGAPALPTSKAAEPAKSSAPTTVELHSDCAKTVSVFYGEKPKFGSGTKSSIGSNTTTTAPRNADGSLTVWIIDDKENGVASAKVDASTKRVDIDKSCKVITAK